MRHFLFAALVAVFAGPLSLQAAEGPVYEMRVYTCEPGKLDALNERFQNHTMRIFEKHGMKNIAYWTPTDGETAATTLIYILEHQSREAAKDSWDAFRNDPEWKQVAKESQEKHGKILAKAPESTYMVATDYSPKTASPHTGRIYELRTYTAADGKIDNLNARFRDHTDKIFQRHGMRALGYWQPTDGEAANNTLIYVLGYESRDAAREAWKAFGADPEWQAAWKASEENGKLLATRPGSVYMQLTDYSPVSPANE
ncbi:MAG: NIPSNAP family protein [Planctomycetaceae bacterium]|nr:NIPSNAP family protein [Planctomycetaceae bacterium]